MFGQHRAAGGLINLGDAGVPAEAVIAALGLLPHPEGGHYRETWRDAPADGARGAGTAIMFLLRAGEVSHWHRVDADEIWIFNAGAPLRLRLSADGRAIADHRVGLDLAAGAQPHVVVPRGYWQAAESVGAWTLVTCTVSPAFAFTGFELAAPGWAPA